MTYLIASLKRPLGDGFVGHLRGCAEADGVVLSAIYGCGGPGCYNLALDCDSEQFVKELTMAMMPARYCTTNEQISGFVLKDLN